MSSFPGPFCAARGSAYPDAAVSTPVTHMRGGRCLSCWAAPACPALMPMLATLDPGEDSSDVPGEGWGLLSGAGGLSLTVHCLSSSDSGPAVGGHLPEETALH